MKRAAAILAVVIMAAAGCWFGLSFRPGHVPASAEPVLLGALLLACAVFYGGAFAEWVRG
jgi:hypothetical protein